MSGPMAEGPIQGRIIPVLFGPMPSSGADGRTGRGQAGALSWPNAQGVMTS
jgi:hypothetical protein